MPRAKGVPTQTAKVNAQAAEIAALHVANAKLGQLAYSASLELRRLADKHKDTELSYLSGKIAGLLEEQGFEFPTAVVGGGGEGPDPDDGGHTDSIFGEKKK